MSKAEENGDVDTIEVATMRIRTELHGDHRHWDCRCACQAIDDPGLRLLMEDGATASAWMGDMCVVPDITGWDRLREKLIANASTLLR